MLAQGCVENQQAETCVPPSLMVQTLCREPWIFDHPKNHFSSFLLLGEAGAVVGFVLDGCYLVFVARCRGLRCLL